MQVGQRHVQQRLQGLEVAPVLAQRVLEAHAMAIKGLRPLLLPFRTKDPALQVLGLQHKHAVHRDHHMVDLRGAAIGQPQRHVVQRVVVLRVQPLRQPAAHQALAQPALEACGAQHAGQQRQAHGQQQPKPHHAVKLLPHRRHARLLLLLRRPA
ncbi:hypothetical protein PV794_01655 [Comamonas aquatica]|nr:hypothetical protein [Comamonas aquatica]MDE1554163.1 hypothetical protein [Comamonas aquatica]